MDAGPLRAAGRGRLCAPFDHPIARSAFFLFLMLFVARLQPLKSPNMVRGRGGGGMDGVNGAQAQSLSLRALTLFSIFVAVCWFVQAEVVSQWDADFVDVSRSNCAG